MVLLTSEIYKAILQTFNSQPPPVRFDSLAAAVLEDSASSLYRAAILSCHFNFSSRVLLVQSMTLAKIVTVMLRSFPRSTGKPCKLRGSATGAENEFASTYGRKLLFLATFWRIRIFIIIIYMTRARKRRDTVA